MATARPDNSIQPPPVGRFFLPSLFPALTGLELSEQPVDEFPISRCWIRDQRCHGGVPTTRQNEEQLGWLVSLGTLGTCRSLNEHHSLSEDRARLRTFS